MTAHGNNAILLFSRDPGGANQMIGVHALLSGTMDDPSVCGHPGIVAFLGRIARAGARGPLLSLAKDFAVTVWRRAGLECLDWADQARTSIPSEALRQLIHDRSVALLVSGTSDIDDDTDIMLWRSAAELGLQVHVFVDQDQNVSRRFITGSGLQARPDFVYLPGEAPRARLLEQGWPAERLEVVPDLHLARQPYRVPTAAGEARKRLRALWGIEDGQRVILFASENVEELSALGKASPYSEFACLHAVLDAVSGKAPIAGLAPTAADVVVIRPHPKDSAGKYRSTAGATACPVTVSDEGTAEEAILAADIVVGMRSSLLAEAERLGRPTVSLAWPADAIGAG